MTIWTIITSVACGALLLITVATQGVRWRWASWIKSRDACAYIPAWTFFAPNPAVTDTRVLWREQFADGGISQWHEMVPPQSNAMRMLWNPKKRARKAISDCAPMVVQLISRDQKSPLPMLSLPYLMLVQHIAGIPGSPLSLARQFTVINTQGADNAEDATLSFLFISHWHRQPGVANEIPLGPDLPELTDKALAQLSGDQDRGR